MEFNIPLSRDRIQFDDRISKKDLEQLTKNADVKVLQTSTASDPKTFKLLNDFFFAHRPEVQLRVYGFYSQTCDLAVCKSLSNVRNFSADCLVRAVNIDMIAAIENVQKLHVGIYELENFDFLEDVNGDITQLSLMASFSKKPRIDRISRFSLIETLYLEGQEKGIEAVSTLRNLRELTLRSISTANLTFLENLNELNSVDIKLGGIRDFSSLKTLKKLRHLEFWQVRKFSDLEFLKELIGVQYLFLQSLPNVVSIPSLQSLTKLRRLYLQNMKGLKDFSGVGKSRSLEEFIIAQAEKQEVSDLMPIFDIPTLRSAAAFFGSSKKNGEFQKILGQRGVAEYKNRGFDYI